MLPDAFPSAQNPGASGARPRSPMYQLSHTTGGRFLVNYSDDASVLSGPHSTLNKETIQSTGPSGPEADTVPSTSDPPRLRSLSPSSSKVPTISPKALQDKVLASSSSSGPSNSSASFTKEEQIEILNKAYEISSNPTPEERRKLGQLVGRTLDQVTNWFKARRRSDVTNTEKRKKSGVMDADKRKKLDARNEKRRLKRHAERQAKAAQNAAETQTPQPHDPSYPARPSKSGGWPSDKKPRIHTRHPQDSPQPVASFAPRPIFERKRKRVIISDDEDESSPGDLEHHSQAGSNGEHSLVSGSGASGTRSSVRLLAKSLAQEDESDELTSLSTSQSPEPPSRPPQRSTSVPASTRAISIGRHATLGTWTTETREYLLRYFRYVNSHPRPDVVAQLAEETGLAASQVSAFFGKRRQEQKLYSYVSINDENDAPAKAQSVESEDDGDTEGNAVDEDEAKTPIRRSTSQQAFSHDRKQTAKRTGGRPHKKARIQLPVQMPDYALSSDAIVPLTPSTSIGASPLTPTSPAASFPPSQPLPYSFNFYDPRAYLLPFMQVPQQTTAFSPLMMNHMMGMNSLGLMGMNIPGTQMTSAQPASNCPSFTHQQLSPSADHSFFQQAPQFPLQGQLNPYMLAMMQQQQAQQLPFVASSVALPINGTAMASLTPAATVIATPEVIRKQPSPSIAQSVRGEEATVGQVTVDRAGGEIVRNISSRLDRESTLPIPAVPGNAGLHSH